MSRIKKIGPIKVLTVLSILIVLSGMAAVTSADGWQSPPNEFYGAVTLNSADAPVGTVINAYIEGELRGTIDVTTAGKYGVSDLDYLKVNGNESEDEGKTITFTVCGAAADQIDTDWNAGAFPRELNLTVDNEAPAVTNANANPTSIVANGTHESQLTVTVEDDSGIDFVTVNLSAIGGSAVQEMSCVGTTDVYSVTVTADANTAPGAYCLYVNASDVFGKCNTSVCIDLEVTTAGLPQTGDINDDGTINMLDAIHLAKYYTGAGSDKFRTISADGDINSDGSINMLDAIHLAKYYTGAGSEKFRTIYP